MKSARIRETNVLHTHEPNSVDLYVVCTYNNNDLWSYVGKDCDTKLFIKLNDLAEQCKKDMTKNHHMIMIGQDCDNFDNATCCHNCNRDKFTRFKQV